jgi:ABC-type transport system substrate-binding protein
MNWQKVLNNYSKRDRAISMLLLVILCTTILFTGCSKVLQLINSAPKKGTYTEGIIGNLNIINPLFNEFSTVNRHISSLIYSGLTKYNPETKIFEPDLATIAVSEDKTKYAFKLKENLTWHNGEPVTIDDVYFTYQTVIKSDNFKNKVLQENLRGIEIKIIATDEIEFTLPKPNTFFISTTNIGILPKHIYKDVPIEQIGTEINEKRIVGTGPYKFSRMEAIDDNTDLISLKQNKQFYGKEPKIKDIKFHIFISEQVMLDAQSTINTIPNLVFESKDKLDKKFKTEEYILPQYTALFLNTENSILSERAVRDALQKGANKKVLSEKLDSKQIISKPYFWFEVIDKIGATNTQDIKEDLYANDWVLNEDGIRIKDEKLLKLDLIAPIFSSNDQKTQEYRTTVNHLQEVYGELGISISASFYESDVFAKLLNTKNYDLAIFGHDLGNNFDSYSFWHSSQGGTNGFNLSNYKSVATDNLLEKLRQTIDPAQRDEIITQLNKKLIEDSPAVFLYTEKHLFTFDNKVKKRNILTTYAFPSDIYYNIHEWEIQ